MGKQAGHGQVFRITGARSSLTEDVRGRQRRYVISMAIRTVCFLLAVALWDVQRYLAIVAMIAGGLLPYVAVVMANAGRERAPGLPSTFAVPPQTRTTLGPAGSAGASAGSPGGASSDAEHPSASTDPSNGDRQ